MERATKSKIVDYGIFFFSVAVLVIAVGVVFFGCAVQYENIPHTNKLSRHEFVMPPETPRYGSIASGGRVWSRMDAPTYGVYFIDNGTDQTYYAHYECVDGFGQDVTVPPRKRIRILVSTTLGAARDGLCKISDDILY